MSDFVDAQTTACFPQFNFFPKDIRRLICGGFALPDPRCVFIEELPFVQYHCPSRQI